MPRCTDDGPARGRPRTAPSLPQQPPQCAARDPTPDAADCTEARAPGRDGGWRGVLPIAPTPRRAAAAVGACVVKALAVSGQRRCRLWAVGCAARAPYAREVIVGTLAMRGSGCWRTWRVGRLNRPSLSRPSGRLRARPARSATQRRPRDPPALARSASDGPRGPRHRRVVSLALGRRGGPRIVGGATDRPRRAGARVRWCRAMLLTARRRS